MEKLSRKQNGIPSGSGSQNSPLRKTGYAVLRGLLIVTTLIYPGFMAMLSAAGWQHNLRSKGGNYPDEVFAPFITWMYIGAALLILGAVLCLLGGKHRLWLCNLLALLCACPGIAACMTVLYRFCAYADRYGYSNQEMQPASEIYRDRLLPMLLPFLLLCTLALLQLFSYDARVYRRQQRDAKRRALNAEAPKILVNE